MVIQVTIIDAHLDASRLFYSGTVTARLGNGPDQAPPIHLRVVDMAGVGRARRGRGTDVYNRDLFLETPLCETDKLASPEGYRVG